MRRDADDVQRYDEVRDTIRTGDVLLYRGTLWISRLIEKVTRSEYSHSGLTAWWDGRLMVLEASRRGVVATPLSQNVRRYHGDVVWFTCTQDIAAEDRARLLAFAQHELGKEYSLWGAVVLGLRLLFERRIERRDALRRERRLICSQYVAQAYNAIGRDLKPHHSDRFMSPRDVAGSPLLRRRGVLKVGRR